VALPWLEVMGEPRAAHAGESTVAQRFVAVYQPGGTILSEWTPSGTETDFTLGPILAPLEAMREKLIVTSGIDMQSAIGEQVQSGMVAWLTGTVQGSYGEYAKGPSIDQVIAGAASVGKQLASLEQAVRWGTGKSHGQPTPYDIVNFADDAAFTPIAPRLDPQQIWNELFGNLESPMVDEAYQRRLSVLDYLDKRYQTVSQRLGAADAEKLAAHLERIRDLEASLAALGGGGACAAPPLVDTMGYDPAAGLGSDDSGQVVDLPTDSAIPLVGRFMTDMLVMALACDLTSVATLMWCDSEAQYTMPWLGLEETHYYYQSGGGHRPEQLAQLGTWYSEQHAYLLEQMDAVDMGGHSLLDESVVFFGSEIQHPATHVKVSMPFLIAGGGGGLRGGRWLSYPGVSHNDLLVTLLNLFGDARTTFGDPMYCTGPLTGLV
jgi:hypothetical protein